MVAASRSFYNPHREVILGSPDPGFILAGISGLEEVHPDLGFTVGTFSLRPTAYIDRIHYDWWELKRMWGKMASIGYDSGAGGWYIGFSSDGFVVYVDSTGSASNNTDYAAQSLVEAGGVLDSHFRTVFGYTGDPYSLDIFVRQSMLGGGSTHNFLFESDGNLYQGAFDISVPTTYDAGTFTSEPVYSDSDSLGLDTVLEAAGGDVSGGGFFSGGGVLHFENYVVNAFEDPNNPFSVCRVKREDPMTDSSKDYVMVFDGSSIRRMIPAENDRPVGSLGPYVVVRGSDGGQGKARYHFLDSQGVDRGSLVIFGSHVHFCGKAERDGMPGAYFSAANVIGTGGDPDNPYTVTYYFLSRERLEEQL